ncbi:hypothetical protein [Sulfitobacter delicatus]|jgi:hypothetical protein|uniref:Uncharacterized protein n=1 Tax=Sulfitobacter delicatus TaxID=218672 RepID=A0A1G7TZJ3_9RHOB|nr:hypothetical protein [Sulfitobacter delicatus]SDG39900.1 hypothetical protein SAMN04489759_10787 [Sulfitobacter delicatus]
MSPPDTDLKKQERRHMGPLIGIALVVIFGIGIIVYWTGEEVATAPEDNSVVEEGATVEGEGTAEVPVAPTE